MKAASPIVDLKTSVGYRRKQLLSLLAELKAVKDPDERGDLGRKIDAFFKENPPPWT